MAARMRENGNGIDRIGRSDNARMSTDRRQATMRLPANCTVRTVTSTRSLCDMNSKLQYPKIDQTSKICLDDTCYVPFFTLFTTAPPNRMPLFCSLATSNIKNHALELS